MKPNLCAAADAILSACSVRVIKTEAIEEALAYHRGAIQSILEIVARESMEVGFNIGVRGAGQLLEVAKDKYQVEASRAGSLLQQFQAALNCTRFADHKDD